MATRSRGSVGSLSPSDLEEIQGFVVQTNAPGQLAEQLAPVAPGVRVEATVAQGFAAQVRAWRLPRVGFVSLDMSHGRTRFGDERNFFVLTVPLAEKAEIYSRCRADECVPGEVHVSPPQEPFDCRHPGGSRFLGASLDAALVRSHARTFREDGRALTDSLPCFISSAAKCASFLRKGSALSEPRVAWESEDLLVAMFVEACWPPPAARGEGGRDALRRAEELLVAHIQTAVSLPEVAAAAGVSLKTLTRAFHKKHGVGPIGFLRRRRLQATRRDLLAAEPSSETVTRVALRYGFAHLGRFAGEYRKAFGEYPSETLCR
jgi:AraC-like DNA-binding protein